MANILKKMLVKRMIFTRKYTGAPVRDYIFGCIKMGMNSDIYCDPFIPNSYYNQGIIAANALKLAVDNYNKNDSKKNLRIVRNKIVKVKIWLHGYSDKVEVIANDDSNRNTLMEAETNIMLSFLTSRKLIKSKKKKSPTPLLSGTRVGNGGFDVEIMNGKGYNPMMTHFILIESSMNATITIVEGEVVIEQEKMGQIIFKSANAKGRYMKFRKVKLDVDFDIYAYSQNGNDNISELSGKITLKG